MTDAQLGEKVIQRFYAYWKLTPSGAKVSYDQLLNILKSRKQMGGNAFLEGLGLGIRLVREENPEAMTDSRIDSAMKKLALASEGKIPEKNYDFFRFLSNEATKVNFVNAVAYTVTESAGDILSGVQDVGESLITTGKILNFLLPAIGLFFVLSWVNKSTDGDLVKAFKSLKK